MCQNHPPTEGVDYELAIRHGSDSLAGVAMYLLSGTRLVNDADGRGKETQAVKTPRLGSRVGAQPPTFNFHRRRSQRTTMLLDRALLAS